MEEKERQYKEILKRFLPESCVEEVYQYIVENHIFFKITNQRKGKLGDYRPANARAMKGYRITVNGDLQPYMFLWVLLHEMAHHETHKAYGETVQPHGKEWQDTYLQLVANWNKPNYFPESTRVQIAKFTATRPYSRKLLTEIERSLQETDREGNTHSETRLSDLPIGTYFRVKSRPGKIFLSEAKLRTRYRCIEPATGMHFLVSGAAPVIVVENT